MGDDSTTTPDSNVRAKVKPPAVAMIVVAALTFLPYLGMSAVIIFNQLTGRGAQDSFGVGGNILFGVMILAISGAYNGMIASGAVGMLKLRSRKNAVLAAVLSLLPICNLGVGIPFGIWSLIVLARPDVKGAFKVESE
jgi:hypothetical protein